MDRSAIWDGFRRLVSDGVAEPMAYEVTVTAHRRALRGLRFEISDRGQALWIAPNATYVDYVEDYSSERHYYDVIFNLEGESWVRGSHYKVTEAGSGRGFVEAKEQVSAIKVPAGLMLSGVWEFDKPFHGVDKDVLLRALRGVR